MPLRLPAAVVLVAAAAAVAAAQPPARVIETSPPEKLSPAPAFLRPVVAPTASSLVVSDAHGLLFVTHRPPRPKDAPPKPGTAWPQLAYARLDAAGVPGPFKAVPLPKPPALAKQANYPTALAFHPKLPLLYVWQDVEAVLPQADATDAPVYKEFDHLLVYHLDGPEPELLLACGRGPRFAFGLGFNALALDPAGTRLFVGNVRHVPPPGGASPGVGYFRLAADGLPDLDADPRPPAADRAGRVAAARALAAKVPAATDGGLKRFSPDKTNLLWAYPCGLGMVAPTADVLLFGGSNGPITWEPGNRRAELVAGYVLPVYRPANLGHLDRLAAHPALPVVYGGTTAIEGATWTDSYLYRTEHADGHPTLIPQRMTLTAFRLGTPPVVLPRHKLLALGGENRVALLTLDAEGRLTKDRAEVQVNAARVWGLAYSEKFDKLYVAEDDPPPSPKEPKK